MPGIRRRPRRSLAALSLGALVTSTVLAGSGGPVAGQDGSAGPVAPGTGDPVPAVVGGEAVAGAEAAGTGCGIARRAGTRIHQVRVNGVPRRYRLTVPRSYTGQVRVPVVMDLHGAGSTARQQTLLSRAPAEARPRGWVVVTANAGRPLWYLQARGGEDVTFLRKVLQDANRRLCIHPGRRFVMGMSNGAAMAAAMTCAAPTVFRAVGAVAGLSIAGSCLARPTPLLAVHGTADPTVRYRGGPLGGVLSGLLRTPSVPNRLREWAVRNGCTTPRTATEVVPTIVRLEHGGCAAPTALLRVDGGGHTWPGGPVLPARLGPTSQAVDATGALFDFFEATLPPD